MNKNFMASHLIAAMTRSGDMPITLKLIKFGLRLSEDHSRNLRMHHSTELTALPSAAASALANE
jgi:hypothetical protein